MCDHHHDGPPPEQVKLVKKFLKDIERRVPGYLQLISFLRKIYSPVDLYDHNKDFKTTLNVMGIKLVWGIHASHAYDHAYVQRYAPDVGCEYTIWSNHDFSKIDPNYPWENYDLFIDGNRLMWDFRQRLIDKLLPVEELPNTCLMSYIKHRYGKKRRKK